jgi:hypothetical protein
MAGIAFYVLTSATYRFVIRYAPGPSRIPEFTCKARHKPIESATHTVSATGGMSF